MALISDVVWRAFSLCYGLVAMAYMLGLACLRGSAFSIRGTGETDELARAQDKLWNLTKPPTGLLHRFFSLRNGLQLHYVVKGETKNPSNLVIFLHGFPDSWALWQELLNSDRLSSMSLLCAVDLPGYGGSDGLSNYGPDDVLEAMTEFILGMRELYLPSHGGLVVVGHDWGGVIAARLASEAPQLANRFILCGTVIPLLVWSNMQALVASSKQMFRTWTRCPLAIRVLRNSVRNLITIISQLSRSFYVFIFKLPQPLPNFFGRFGNSWFINAIFRIRARTLFPEETPLDSSLRDGFEAAVSEYTASSIGPGLAQTDGTAYPPSVAQRIHDGGWSEKIRLYREGLVLGPWTKSLSTIVALNDLNATHPVPIGDSPPGSLKVPTTIVHARNDRVFEPQLILGGISDFLPGNSQVLVVEQCGHWIPTDPKGSDLLVHLVAMNTAGRADRGSKSFQQELQGCSNVTVVLEK